MFALLESLLRQVCHLLIPVAGIYQRNTIPNWAAIKGIAKAVSLDDEDVLTVNTRVRLPSQY